jgi:AcrR family transcriptional regulator
LSHAAGLRERKKTQTRDALVASAFELFARRGYEHTTVDDIADAANVSPRTFFRYFASKDDVIFSGFPDAKAELIAALEARPRSEPAISSLRHAALAVAARESDDVDATRTVLGLLTSSPALAHTYLGLLSEIEAAVVEWAASRLRTSTSDLRPRLLAAAAIAARRAAVDAWREQGYAGDLQALLGEALDRMAKGLESL